MQKEIKKYMALLLICIFAVCGAAGCKGKTSGNTGEGSGTGNQTSGNTQTINPGGEDKTPVSKDYPNGLIGMAGRLMLYGKGLYYDKGISEGLHYVDLEKKIDLPLCNKPECRHDGNAFCAATNGKYKRAAGCIYGDRLLLAATEETDTQYLFKLLSVALDGSGLDELMTFYTLEKTEELQISMGVGGGSLFLHRNKVFLCVEATGQENLDDTVFGGNFVIDLETKEVSALGGGELFGKGVMAAENLQACGDGIFFSMREGTTGKAKNRYTLYEYNIKDKTTQKWNLQSGFRGTYAVVDEDTVYYYRTKDTELWVCHKETGQSELAVEFKDEEPFLVAGDTFAGPGPYSGDGIATDGTYLYIPQKSFQNYIKEEDRFVHVKLLRVFDKELNEVARTNVAEVMRVVPYEGEGEPWYSSVSFEFAGEEIYMRCTKMLGDVVYGWCLIYKMKRSDLLAGTPVAEWVCEIE